MTTKWTFPSENQIMMKIETFTLAGISLLIFIFTFFQLNSMFSSLIFVVIFVGLYLIIAYFTKLIRQVEEHYHLTPTHLEVTRKSRFKTKKEKVHLKKIHHWKLDSFFLGGYALSDKGKHLLFFNNKKELNKFEKHIKKHGKKSKA
jgi:hypothetical protein